MKAIFVAFFISICSIVSIEAQSENFNEVYSNSCIDYNKSFICNTSEINSVRMWIESRTIIIDNNTGKSNIYYQCGSCKSENTFGDKDLFYENNYDFLPIFGDGKVLVFRRHAEIIGDGYKSTRNMVEMWGENPIIYSPKAKKLVELNSWEMIKDATAQGLPIIAQIEINNMETGLKAIIEFPCKTMNISSKLKMYQVDTGPIALPDLTKRFESEINSLDLAFTAFNKNSTADFIIEVPTVISGSEIAKVYHYSKIVTMDANIRIFACGKVKLFK